VHKSSVLPDKPTRLPTDWVFYEEMTRPAVGSTFKALACIRCCTVVSPVTVTLFAGPARLSPDALKDTAATHGIGGTDSV